MFSPSHALAMFGSHESHKWLVATVLESTHVGDSMTLSYLQRNIGHVGKLHLLCYILRPKKTISTPAKVIFLKEIAVSYNYKGLFFNMVVMAVTIF